MFLQHKCIKCKANTQKKNIYSWYNQFQYFAWKATDMYPFSELKQTSVINNDFCYGKKTNYLPGANNLSLCSFYNFDHPFMCQVPESQLRFNRDRGTPLICDNRIVGILSIIIPTNITNSTDICGKSLQAYAYYINVALYETWTHSVIAINSPAYTNDGKPISHKPISPPFQSNLRSKYI